MIPCELGMRCPYHYPDDEHTCTYPYIPTGCTREELERSETDPYSCPMIDQGTDMQVLMSMCNQYDAWQWGELLKRFTVHLDRSCDDFRHRQRERAAEDVWEEYVDSLGLEE